MKIIFIFLSCLFLFGCTSTKINQKKQSLNPLVNQVSTLKENNFKILLVSKEYDQNNKQFYSLSIPDSGETSCVWRFLDGNGAVPWMDITKEKDLNIHKHIVQGYNYEVYCFSEAGNNFKGIFDENSFNDLEKNKKINLDEVFVPKDINWDNEIKNLDTIKCNFKISSNYSFIKVYKDKGIKTNYSDQDFILEFTNLNSNNPKLKGNLDSESLKVIRNDDNRIELVEKTPSGNLIFYNIYKKSGIGTWYKSYTSNGDFDYAMLSMGYCY